MNVLLGLKEVEALSFQSFIRIINRSVTVRSDLSVGMIDSIQDAEVDLFIIDIDHIGRTDAVEILKRIRYFKQHRYQWLIVIADDDRMELEMYREFKCREYIVRSNDMNLERRAMALLENKITYKGRLSDRFFIYRKNGKEHRIRKTDIIYVDVYYKNCRVYTKHGEYDIGRLGLNQVALKLGKDFLRCHRSYIVNKAHIDKQIRDEELTFIQMSEADRDIPVGRIYKKEIQGVLDMLIIEKKG